MRPEERRSGFVGWREERRRLRGVTTEVRRWVERMDAVVGVTARIERMEEVVGGG